MNSMANKRTYALVELHVTVSTKGIHNDRSAAVRRAIARDKSREQAVIDILNDPALKSADVIMFPGWTVRHDAAPDQVPPNVLKTIGSREVILETFGGTGGDKEIRDRWFHVLHGTTDVLGPISQWVVTANQARLGGGPSLASMNLAAEIASKTNPQRRWSGQNNVPSALLVCGEINVVQAGTPPYFIVPSIGPNLAPSEVIFNPAHTPTSLQKMRDKREFLSLGKLLLTTANIHSQFRYWCWRKSTKRWRGRLVTARTAAEAFIDGTQYNAAALASMGRLLLVGNHRVLIFNA